MVADISKKLTTKKEAILTIHTTSKESQRKWAELAIKSWLKLSSMEQENASKV